MTDKKKLRQEIMDGLVDEIKDEFVKDVKMRIKKSLTREIGLELDIEEYVEDIVEYDTDIELWVENLKSIYDTIDQSEELSLEVLNDKFEELVRISSVIVVQLRIIKQFQYDLKEQLKATNGYGVLGEMAKAFQEGKEEVESSPNENSFYL